jgi:parallel beta-helix repeat protein
MKCQWFTYHFKSIAIAFLLVLSYHSSKAQFVEVGGIIANNTFWSKDTTYIVSDNLKVTDNALLEIEPGTVIKINQGRSITIENGRLKAEGTVQDSISFVPNHFGQESWYWNGLIISSVNQENDVSIAFVHIRRAVQGIKVISSSYVNIRNSLIFDNRNLGINLTNSSFCQISDNYINRNFVGIEIYAADPGNKSASNQIINNNLRNGTTNILVQNNNHGACPDNLIQGNLIKQGTNGIWLSNNNDNGGSGNAIIRENIFYQNGNATDGYGIYVSMDSTNVMHNLFIENTIAASFMEATKCHFLFNNIYANQKGFIAKDNSSLITLLDNTFTENSSKVVQIMETNDFGMEQNNFFGNLPQSNLIENLNADNQNIPDNFWGTMNTEMIDAYIYDGNDEQGLGIVNYLPIRQNINIEAPISAPRMVISQIVNNYIKVSWQPNPEADLMGYRVYFGSFEHYTFTDSTQLTTETFVHLPLEAINNPIAVVAFDTQASGISSRRQGHASPFAFARPLPYAGPDAIYCANEAIIPLLSASLPFDADSVRWNSSGDGTFENDTTLTTNYVPGSNDRALLEFSLSITAYYQNSFSTDSLLVQLNPLPIFRAGNDTLLAMGSTYNTSSASSNTQENLWWFTSGDGTFVSADSLHTIYEPGPLDQLNGEVQLSLQISTTYCGTLTDTMQVALKNVYKVSGNVSGAEEALPNLPVLAIPLNNESLPRKIVQTNTTGDFLFENLFEGAYVFYSVPPKDREALQGTYHANANNWQSAFKHQLIGDIFDLDIQLKTKDFELPTGQAAISGRIRASDILKSQLAVYCSDWFNNTSQTYCADGLSNASVLLYSESKRYVYDFTLSDSSGSFSFQNLPYGTYHLHLELAPFSQVSTTAIVLSPENPESNAIEINLLPENKFEMIVPDQNLATEQKLITYPNPFNDYLELYLPDNNSLKATLFLWDQKGNKVLQLDWNADANRKIDLQHLSPGIYFIQLLASDKTYSAKIIKQ